MFSQQLEAMSLGNNSHRWQVEKVTINLPTLAGYTTLFFLVATCTRLQVYGHVDNLHTRAGLWPLFGVASLCLDNLHTYAGLWPLLGVFAHPGIFFRQ